MSKDTYTCSKCGGLYHGMYEICPADLSVVKSLLESKLGGE